MNTHTNTSRTRRTIAILALTIGLALGCHGAQVNRRVDNTNRTAPVVCN